MAARIALPANESMTTLVLHHTLSPTFEHNQTQTQTHTRCGAVWYYPVQSSPVQFRSITLSQSLALAIVHPCTTPASRSVAAVNTSPNSIRAAATTTGLSPLFHLADLRTGSAGSFCRPPRRSDLLSPSQSAKSHRSNARSVSSFLPAGFLFLLLLLVLVLLVLVLGSILLLILSDGEGTAAAAAEESFRSSVAEEEAAAKAVDSVSAKVDAIVVAVVIAISASASASEGLDSAFADALSSSRYSFTSPRLLEMASLVRDTGTTWFSHTQ
mmetsp:Transcript_18163/g.50583  ORF Transcript_18163/g.50583 Transcript_18163/m.50583 type:complete len:270 (-) Transcript_18163:262-1071(-)